MDEAQARAALASSVTTGPVWVEWTWQVAQTLTHDEPWRYVGRLVGLVNDLAGVPMQVQVEDWPAGQAWRLPVESVEQCPDPRMGEDSKPWTLRRVLEVVLAGGVLELRGPDDIGGGAWVVTGAAAAGDSHPGRPQRADGPVTDLLDYAHALELLEEGPDGEPWRLTDDGVGALATARHADVLGHYPTTPVSAPAYRAPIVAAVEPAPESTRHPFVRADQAPVDFYRRAWFAPEVVDRLGHDRAVAVADATRSRRLLWAVLLGLADRHEATAQGWLEALQEQDGTGYAGPVPTGDGEETATND